MDNKLELKMVINDNAISYNRLDKLKCFIMEKISNCLKGSYGPYGSHTLLFSKESGSMYTKDGKTILDNLIINGELAHLILNECKSIANHMACTVGDATTSVILLSNILLNKILESEDSEINKSTPYNISRTLEKVSNDLINRILENSQEFNSDMAYHIALTSSNGDKEIADVIKKLYDEYGNSIVIEPKYSPNNTNYHRVFDGSTLDYSLRSSEFVNAPDGKCILTSPEIYYFKDPIDTKEMITATFTIINENILIPLQSNKAPISTLIIAPKYSRDFDIKIAPVLKALESMYYTDRPEFAIIEANKDFDMLSDVMKLSGGMEIAKTLTSDNADQMKYDDISFLREYKGYADSVIIDSSKTIFKGLFSIDKNGNKINKINEVIANINNEINIETKRTSPNYTYINSRKKRIKRLNSVIIYLYIASIGVSDKHNKFMIMEDVCTSVMNSAEYGVGRASSFELLNVTKVHDFYDDNLSNKLLKYINESVTELIKILLNSAGIKDNSEMDNIINNSLNNELPYNIITNEYDDKLVTSIRSDVEILKSVSEILGKLIITNQVLLSKEPSDIYY